MDEQRMLQNEDLPGEEWKTVELEGIVDDHYYQISNRGRLRSFKRNKKDGEIIKSYVVDGYKAFSFRKENWKKTTRYVHKLVAEAFLPKDNSYKKYVLHQDFDKQNNDVENLVWADKLMLDDHRAQNPNITSNYGRVTNSKLTEEKVRELKLRLKTASNNTRLKTIAKEFGITHTQLNRIRSGENWAHVKLEGEE